MDNIILNLTQWPRFALWTTSAPLQNRTVFWTHPTVAFFVGHLGVSKPTVMYFPCFLSFFHVPNRLLQQCIRFRSCPILGIAVYGLQGSRIPRFLEGPTLHYYIKLSKFHPLNIPYTSEAMREFWSPLQAMSWNLDSSSKSSLAWSEGLCFSN